jgi:hypothetical protein
VKWTKGGFAVITSYLHICIRITRPGPILVLPGTSPLLLLQIFIAVPSEYLCSLIVLVDTLQIISRSERMSLPRIRSVQLPLCSPQPSSAFFSLLPSDTSKGNTTVGRRSISRSLTLVAFTYLYQATREQLVSLQLPSLMRVCHRALRWKKAEVLFPHTQPSAMLVGCPVSILRCNETSPFRSKTTMGWLFKQGLV